MSKKTELPRCRFCGSELQDTFVDLGMQPLCESYSGPDQLNQMEPLFPLHTYVCRNCFLAQLEDYVSPERIFAEYAYFSSYSETWLKDAKKHAEMIIDRLGLDGKSQAMEIGAPYDEPRKKKIKHIMESSSSQRTNHWFAEDTFFSILRSLGIGSSGSRKYDEGFFVARMELAFPGSKIL
jgi:hypothetical protein